MCNRMTGLSSIIFLMVRHRTICYALLLCMLLVPPVHSSAINGAFIGNNPTRKTIAEYENNTGVKLQSVLFFHAAKKGFIFPLQQCQLLDSEGIVPFIKFEPWSWGGKYDSSFSLEKIIRGDLDGDLMAFARGAADYGKPFYFSFAHEMNADLGWRWYPWQGKPDKYVDAYRRVHDIFRSAGASNAKWVWTINANSASFARYYPGDQYVDLVGIDGYSADWSANPSDPAALFDQDITKINASYPGKPIIIAETGYDLNNGGSDQGKREFLRKLPAYCAAKGIPFFYFDIDKIEDSISRSWGLRNGYYKVLGDAVSDKGISRRVQKREVEEEDVADTSDMARGIPLSRLIRVDGTFNGAEGGVKDVQGATEVTFSFDGQGDPGVALKLSKRIKGKLAFRPSGHVSGGARNGDVTLLMIKTGYSGDAVTEEYDFSASDRQLKTFIINIPVDKINFMVVGPKPRGSVTLSDIRFMEE